MVGIMDGDTGSFCHYCNHTKASVNDITNIVGFWNNKNLKWVYADMGRKVENLNMMMKIGMGKFMNHWPEPIFVTSQLLTWKA